MIKCQNIISYQLLLALKQQTIYIIYKLSMNSKFITISHQLAKSQNQKQSKKQSHFEYFQHLEQRLLIQSEKLTKIMGKSLINDLSSSKLKLSESSSRKQLLSSNTIDQDMKNRSVKSINEFSLQKAKDLCFALKQAKLLIMQKPKIGISKPIENGKQSQRKWIYNYCPIKDKVLDKQKFSANEITKASKFYNLINDNNKSLKQTISTQHCKSQNNSPEDLQEAQKVKISEFQILKYLEEGKFGSVFFARHQKTGFLCAIKQISKQIYHKNNNQLIQLMRQIKIQSFLDHPNIVQLYRVFIEEGNIYLMLELCHSANLYTQLKTHGRFSEDKVKNIIRQVCHAVQYMHDNDIIHRDLKPQNILFHENIVKICDFGWSVSSPLLRDTLCGTPIYNSPEVVQKQQYDNKIDIWNIGILTYELMFGQVPFEIRSEGDLMKVVQEQVYFPKKIPASLQIKDFINHCLCKNPKKRYTIAKLLDHDYLTE